ncbi:hypothetical protein QUH12_25085, partial [Klebsiella pneumoniae]|nr:hypothetical protein [Klebsiella pneumoniae]
MLLAKKQTMIVMGEGTGCHEKRQFVRGEGSNKEHLNLTCMVVLVLVKLIRTLFYHSSVHIIRGQFTVAIW